MEPNKNWGIDYVEKEDLKRAEKADLITLPKEVKGTNCSNCKFVQIVNAKLGVGFCTNEAIQLSVTKRMCCALWDAEGVIRSWE